MTPLVSPAMVRKVSSFCSCHVSTAPSLENNMDTLGVEGPSRRGSQAGQRSTSPSPSSRSRSKERRPSTKNATGHLAAHAFNLMVTVPQNISTEGGAEDSAISLGKLTPDLLCSSNHYEADISDQSDTCLGVPVGPGTAKSAPSTPQTEQRLVPRPLPRHDTFVAPGVSPALPTSPNNFRPMKLKTTSFSKSNRHALKNLSRSTPAMSPSASPRHSDSEGPPRVSKGTKKFMRHFAADAPPSERVLNYFACALVSDILLQGTLYITPNFFAFYSKIFGHVSRLLIPISQVASVQKERTAKIIPNAVGLQTLDGKSYVFGSLLSRDSTYKLMTHLWKKAQMIQDSDSEPPSGVPLPVEDDCDDSGSGSGESFADEDQPDGGPGGGGRGSYLASAAITTLTGVVASSPAAPWTSVAPPTLATASPTAAALTSSTSSSSAAVGGTSSALTSTLLTSPTNIVGGGGGGNTLALSSINEVATAVSLRRDSLTATKSSSSLESTESEGRGLLGWLTEGTIVKTCCRMGSIPLRLIGDAMREIWALPRTSLLLLISTLLLLMLFASAAFMLHRVDVLSQQLGLEKYDEYDGMYEEVLQMQQRLHAAASSEIEKTLSIQLKHIATVRQSLEALVVLFNKEPPVNTARIPDNT